MNLLRHITWEQPDYMWQYQLKYERDVIAQSEVGELGRTKVILLYIVLLRQCCKVSLRR